MSQYVPATQARKNFFQLLKKASRPGGVVTITHSNLPPVVMMSQEEFEGWMETFDIMSDPQLVAELKAAEEEEGAIPWEDVEKELDLLNKK